MRHLESRLHVRKCHDEGDNCRETNNEKTADTRDYFIEFNSPSTKVTGKLAEELKLLSSNMTLSCLPNSESDPRPWFPRHISDLRRCCTALFKYGEELATDHPGYGDENYVQRRKVIAEISKNYQ